MDARTVIIRPVISEKSYALIAEGKYTFRVHDRGPQDPDRAGGRGDLRGRGRRRAHREGAREAEAPRPAPRQDPRLEEGGRPARPRRADRAVRGRGGRVELRRWRTARQSRPAPGAASPPIPLREQVTTDKPERKLTEGLRKSGGRNSNGRVTAPPPRRRRQAALPADRLQARSRTACRRRSSTIEYDPNRSCYIALLHYADGAKSYILAPAQIKVGDTVQSGPERRHPRPATRWRCARCRPARSSTTSSWSPARAASSAAPPAPRSRSRRRRATTSPCGCPPRRCGWCAPSAARRSARSPTPSIRTSRSARPVAAATRASARRRAAWR